MSSVRVIQCVLVAASLLSLAAAQTLQQEEEFYKKHSGSAPGKVTFGQGERGSETILGGLNAYVTTPSKGHYHSAVLIFPEIYGYNTTSIRAWADRLANEGFLVVIPDYFKGNPWKLDQPLDGIYSWLALYPQAQVLNETSKVLDDIRARYKSVKQIGAEGFCWGGRYAILLTQGNPPTVPVAVEYHGSFITPQDVQAINAPAMFQQSDPNVDSIFPLPLYQQVSAVVAQKKADGLDISITYYPGTGHGFAVRPPPNATDAAATAYKEGTAFLKKYLK